VKKKAVVRKTKPRKIVSVGCKKCKHSDISNLVITQLVPVCYSRLRLDPNKVIAVDACKNEVVWDSADEPVVRCRLCGDPATLPKGTLIEWE